MNASSPAVLNSEDERYPAFRWLVLIFAVFGYIHIQMTYLAVAPVIPVISSSLHTDPGTATIILMSAFLAASTLTWFSIGGYICDRFGVFVALILGLICLTLPPALLPWIGETLGGVLIVRIVEGFSAGLMYPSISPITKTLFPSRQRGLANGLLNSSIAVGNSAGVFVGPLVLTVVGGDWKRMSVGISVFGWVCLIFGAVLYFYYNARLPKEEAVSGENGKELAFRAALFSPFTFVGLAVAFAALWTTLCLYSLTSTYLAANPPLGAGYGSVIAGRLTLGTTLVGGVLGPILSGFLLDKVFHGKVKWILYIGFGLTCVCTYLLTFPSVTHNIILLETDLILAGFGSMFAFPTMYYVIACTYPARIVGRMSALWGATANCAGVLGLYIAGATIKAYGSYNITLTLQAAIAGMGFLLTIPLLRLRRKLMETSS